jgi:hypothetical protein
VSCNAGWAGVRIDIGESKKEEEKRGDVLTSVLFRECLAMGEILTVVIICNTT